MVALSVVPGAVMAQAGRIEVIDISEDKFEMARLLGATDFVNPKQYDKPIQEVIVDLTDGCVDYSFECVGNVDLMRSFLECCHKGSGESVIIEGGRRRQGDFYPAFPTGDGRVWHGSAFGGVKGRTELPGYVERYMAGEIEIDSMVTHRMGLEDINQAFDLMHTGGSIRSVILY